MYNHFASIWLSYFLELTLSSIC